MGFLDLLRADEFLGESENIEIAKGKYKLPGTIKEGLKQVKRSSYERRNN